ncbi:hypothetical protein ACWDR3_32840 [Streptomyces sp. NPDC001002]
MHDHHDRRELPGRQLPDRLRAVGPGWHPLLLQLHGQLLTHVSDYWVEDVKEKLGTARIHLAPAEAARHPQVRDLVASTEQQSAVTCEFCGSPGSRRTRGDRAGGWMKTVCDSCHPAWSGHTLIILNGALHRRPPRRG